jgi:hypothetical protein
MGGRSDFPSIHKENQEKNEFEIKIKLHYLVLIDAN